jgi:glycosyltransferase involved in cell wall biosynthesis
MAGLPKWFWRALAFVRPSLAWPSAGLAPSSKVIQLAGATENADWFVEICSRLRQQGYDVMAVIGAPEGGLARQLRAAGVPYRTVELSFSPTLGRLRVLVYLVRVPLAVLRLAWFFRTERVAVVHTHIFNSIVIGRLAAWLAGVPCRVSMVPGPLHLDAPLTRWADQSTWWMDHRVVAGCEWTRSRYEELGLRAPRLTCIKYGVNPVRFDPARADPARIRRELGVQRDTPVIGLVAYFYPPRRGWHTPPYLRERGVKGHEDLIEAAVIVRARRPDARFVLVGAGWGVAGEAYRLQLMARCRDEGLGDAVIFTGLRHDVADLLAAFDVAVQCSLSENYGGTVESLLMQTPTVATRVGGMPETVRHGETGLLVPAADPAALAGAILETLDDTARARAMAAAGRELMLDRFQIAQTATSIAALYDRLLHREPAGGVLAKSA